MPGFVRVDPGLSLLLSPKCNVQPHFFFELRIKLLAPEERYQPSPKFTESCHSLPPLTPFE